MGREQTDGGPVSHMLISSEAKSSLWKSQGVREREMRVNINILSPSISVTRCNVVNSINR